MVILRADIAGGNRQTPGSRKTLVVTSAERLLGQVESIEKKPGSPKSAY
jgi:hypothetical protein